MVLINKATLNTLNILTWSLPKRTPTKHIEKTKQIFYGPDTHTEPLSGTQKKKQKKIVYAGASFLLLNGTGYQTGRVRDKDRLVSFVMWAQPQKEFKLAFIWVLTKLCERYHKH